PAPPLLPRPCAFRPGYANLDFVVDEAAFAARFQNEALHGFMGGMHLVRVQRGPRFELRHQDDVAGGLFAAEVDPDLQAQHPRNAAAERLELFLDRAGVVRGRAAVRLGLEAPQDDVRDHAAAGLRLLAGGARLL